MEREGKLCENLQKSNLTQKQINALFFCSIFIWQLFPISIRVLYLLLFLRGSESGWLIVGIRGKSFGLFVV